MNTDTDSTITSSTITQKITNNRVAFFDDKLENALQSISSSSSPIANLMEQAKQQAAAKLLKDIKYI